MSRDIRSTYLGHQLEMLRRGMRSLSCPVEPIAEFLRRSQNADGGFSGRGEDSDSSQSDLYYTAFGLWGLAALDRLSMEVADRAVRFLAECWQRPTHLVDFFSLLHSYRLIRDIQGGEELVQSSLPAELRGQEFDWVDLVTAGLETCRSLDGGYARTPGQRGGSTYATFLTVLCYQEIERPLPDAETIRQFLQSRQRADGGFVELGPMKRSGTNPTAAAVAVRRILGDAVPSEDEAVREFLIGLQGPDGGLRANTVIPISDLLSTFTGLWTLTESGGLEGLDVEKVQRFVKMMEHPDGGFLAGLWDDVADVEYAFYGLGSSALLSLASAGNDRSSGATI
jgi:geranylgeranyl transferase type-2 subunit beta